MLIEPAGRFKEINTSGVFVDTAFLRGVGVTAKVPSVWGFPFGVSITLSLTVETEGLSPAVVGVVLLLEWNLDRRLVVTVLGSRPKQSRRNGTQTCVCVCVCVRACVCVCVRVCVRGPNTQLNSTESISIE